MADGINYSLKGFDQYNIMLGDELRGERATMGKSLLDVQKELKIKASYISAIESCDLEVFSNKGFIAGYVRSYARYLGLDSKVVYERFCLESGFSLSNQTLNLDLKKNSKSTIKQFGLSSNWIPGKIGLKHDNSNLILDGVLNFAPVFVLLAIIVGTSFGAFSVLKEIQKLNIVAVEGSPTVLTELPKNRNNLIRLNSGLDIYSSEELALPLFEPRDKAISTLEPSILTALVDGNRVQPIIYHELTGARNEHFNDPIYSLPTKREEPVIRTQPTVPKLKIFALTPAWVRLKNRDGAVIFEKILQARETYFIKKEIFGSQLRAGNAQNVYFVLDDDVLGPLSSDRSVVKNVILDPAVIKKSWAYSAIITKSYHNIEEENIPINTADNSD